MTDPNTPDQPGAPVPPASQPAPAYGAPAYGQPAYAQPSTAKTNTLAIVSLVSSFFISIVGIITGHIALSQIKKTGEQGRGLAIAGLIIGYIGLVVGIIVAIFWIAALGVVASNPDLIQQ